jgi:hypothetical protein
MFGKFLHALRINGAIYGIFSVPISRFYVRIPVVRVSYAVYQLLPAASILNYLLDLDLNLLCSSHFTE